MGSSRDTSSQLYSPSCLLFAPSSPLFQMPWRKGKLGGSPTGGLNINFCGAFLGYSVGKLWKPSGLLRTIVKGQIRRVCVSHQTWCLYICQKNVTRNSPGSGQTSDYLPGNIEIGENKCQSWCQNFMNISHRRLARWNVGLYVGIRVTCCKCQNMLVRINIRVSPSFEDAGGRLWKALLKP